MENETNEMNNNILPTEEKKEGSVGPIVGSIIIIILIIIGGMYFWGSIVEKKQEQQPTPQETPEAASVENIEADLDALDIESLDEGLTEIEAEIDAALEE